MMKKLLVLAGLVLAFMGSLNSAPVPTQKATEVAVNMYYLTAYPKTGIPMSSLIPELVYTKSSGTHVLYYVFGFQGQQGWVMVAGDDANYPVIGYSTESNFPMDESLQPPAFLSYLSMVESTLLSAIEQGRNLPEIHAVWKKMEVVDPLLPDNTTSVVAPLITSLWDQGCNFNQSCPATGGVHPAGPCNRVLTGCVATAMAMIMKYWNFPGVGTSSHSYTDPANTTTSCAVADPSYGTLSRTFNTNYNWWDMPNVPTTTTTGIPALMYDCGVAVDMNYAYCTSGAWPAGNPVVANALKNFFRYASSTTNVLRSSYTETNWINLLKNELNNGRPVDYGNQNHSWVFDGYEDNYNGTGQTYFHMNWGWSGTSNGYFTVNSASVGTSQEAIIGIAPSVQAPIAPTDVAASQGVYSGAIDVSWRWASNASHYRVYRNTVNNSSTATALGAWQNALEYTDNTPLPGVTYYYWVKSATSSSGTSASAFSPPATGYTETPDVLTSKLPVINTETPRYFTFTNSGPYWAAVGVRPALTADDWDVKMYSDNTFTTLNANSVYGVSMIDFVVLDGNHVSSASRGIKSDRYSGTGVSTIEFDGGSDMLYEGDNPNISWGILDVVKCWDVYLTPGTYRFELSMNSGSLNAGLALFSSGSGTYFFSRAGAVAAIDANGNGASESLTYTITASDYYGFVVFGNNPSASNFDIRIEKAGTWTGLVDNNWHNAGNWSAGIVPTADLDVTIPLVINKPWIWTAAATCRNLTLESGAGNYLRIWDNTLTITGDAHFHAELLMDNAVPTAILEISGDCYWESGSSSWMAANTEVKLFGDLELNAGSLLQLQNGTFTFAGTVTTYIRSYNSGCYLYDVEVTKTSSAAVWYSTSSTQRLQINGHLWVGVSGGFVCNSDSALYVRGYLYSGGDFHCNTGTVVMDGSAQSLTIAAANYFNNLVISPYSYVNMGSDLGIHGNFILESGALYTNNFTVNIMGDWTNLVGPSAFSEGTGRVVFNGGNYHQYCSTENFYILEVNKASGGAFRVNGGQVYCAQYDWTAGAVDVLTGTFTAMSLADNGIAGAFYNNAGGTINLHNPYGYVDLNGSMNIYGGEVNVFGGTSDSYWPYAGNASIYMSGGVLDFKDVGVYLYNTASYTFAENISGGTIKANGSFTCYRTDFTPAGGAFSFTGSNYAGIYSVPQSYFNDLIIERTAGSPVYMASEMALKDDLLISSGILNPNGFKLRVYGDWTNEVGPDGFVEGTAEVEFLGSNISTIQTSETFNYVRVSKTYAGIGGVVQAGFSNVTIGDSLNINSGNYQMGQYSQLHVNYLTMNVGAGLNATQNNTEIYLDGFWNNYNTSFSTTQGFNAGFSNTVYVQGTGPQVIYCNSTYEKFHHLIIQKPAYADVLPYTGFYVGGTFEMTGGSINSVPVRHFYFEGNVTISGLAAWDYDQVVHFLGGNTQDLTFSPMMGQFSNVFVEKNPGSILRMQSDVNTIGTGILTVSSGILDLNGYDYSSSWNATIGSSGVISVPAGSAFKISGFSTLQVGSGGKLELLGTLGNPARLIRMSAGNYDLFIEAGGTLSADYAEFEGMGADGIYLKSGSLVDPVHSLNNCTFHYSASGGALLRVDNSQDFTVQNAVFPANTWSGTSNVRKTIASGNVYFLNYTGAFGGSAFENDPFSRIHWTAAGSAVLQGTITYNNAVSTPLTNVKVVARLGNVSQDSTQSQSNGTYSLNNLPVGAYTLRSSSTKTWGGVNSTDALKIMRHFTAIEPLTGLKKTAADVDGSTFINSIDALTTMKRFVGVISTFPTPDWIFENSGITLIAGVNTLNYKGLCMGDVDGSYIPPAKQESAVMLVNRGTMEYNPGSRFSLPLIAGRDIRIGAVSLNLSLPAGLQVISASLPSDPDALIYNVDEGFIRLAWASTEPLALSEGDTLILLDCAGIQGMYTGNDPLIAASESELADENAVAYPSETLYMPKLIKPASSDVFECGQAFPLPFQDVTNVPVYLPFSGSLEAYLMDAEGRRVQQLDFGTLPAGSHELSIFRETLSSGSYTLHLEYRTPVTTETRVQKLVILP